MLYALHRPLVMWRNLSYVGVHCYPWTETPEELRTTGMTEITRRTSVLYYSAVTVPLQICKVEYLHCTRYQRIKLILVHSYQLPGYYGDGNGSSFFQTKLTPKIKFIGKTDTLENMTFHRYFWSQRIFFLYQCKTDGV